MEKAVDQAITPTQEYEVRKQKVSQLLELGIQPWPSLRKPTALIRDISQDSVEQEVSLVGRLMSRRDHGKSFFCQLKDRTGQIQLYVKDVDVGNEAFELFKKLIDIGDHLWVSGKIFVTRTGETTLKVKELILQSKCLRPLANKHSGLTDTEQKYRQRYLDMICNDDSIVRFKRRSDVVSSIRNFLMKEEFIEVETPMLHPISGGAMARPFATHHNTYDMDLFLRIAPELYLKRLVVGGMERVFEINRNFRNEGVSTKHNPEFTMLEFYMSYGDYYDGMAITQALLKEVACKIVPSGVVQFGEQTLDFNQDFKKITIKDSVVEIGGLSEASISAENIDATMQSKGIVPERNISYGEKILMLFDEVVEHKIVQPTFITQYPLEVSPLAKEDPENPGFAARFELFICGMEVSNGYTELNDPIDQDSRFAQQVETKAQGDEEAHEYDHDYIQALEYALPPTAGVGIGIDRLTMLLTDTQSIKDVILFPTLRQKQ